LVHLARVTCTNVIALVLVLPEVANNVRTGSDGLCLERFNLAKRHRIQFVWYDAKQIFFQRKLVYDCQCVSGVYEYLDFSTIASIIELDGYAGVNLNFCAFRQDNESAPIQFDKCAVLKISACHGGRRVRIKCQNGRELCRTCSVLLDRESCRG